MNKNNNSNHPILNPNGYLLNKWKDRIPKGWYGFDGIRVDWVLALDDFLCWLKIQCPKFEIHQIKEKFGMLCVHIQTNTKDAMINEEVQDRIDKLEYLCTNYDF